jgi:hypothetical protein
MGLSGNIIVAVKSGGSQLVGLNAADGTQKWELDLEDCIQGEPFDSGSNAKSLYSMGKLMCFQTIDEMSHVIDPKKGKLLRSEKGRLSCPWPGETEAVGFYGVPEGASEEVFRLWDIERDKQMLELDHHMYSMFRGKRMFGVVFESNYPHYATEIHVFKTETLDPKGTFLVETEDGNTLHFGYEENGWNYLLDESRMFIGCSYDTAGFYMVDLGEIPPPVKKKSFWEKLFGEKVVKIKAVEYPVPEKGYEFAACALVKDVMVCGYVKSEGTRRLILQAYDISNMEVLWTQDGLGGTYSDHYVLGTKYGVLAPVVQKDESTWSEKNHTAYKHFDAKTGEVKAEYEVADIDCVEVHEKYLCGFSDWSGWAWPVVYDLEQNERIL